MSITRYGRFWAVYDGEFLVCVCVYKRGAEEVVRRLQAQEAAHDGVTNRAEHP